MTNRVGQNLGNYRLLRLLGQGSFAEVYLGEHLYLKNYAAIKVLHTSLQDEDVGKFLTEAQTLARLAHPNIVRVLDFAVEQGTPFLVMEYAPRGTVRQRYPRGTLLSLTTTVAYTKQIASALQYAHNRNVIHRDVKPDNILLGAQEQVMLSDFGIALLSPSAQQMEGQDMSGTVPYMAPEQLRGKASFASDQYALGIIVYEWLCGVRPFEGPQWELIRQHLFTPPPPLREKDPSLPIAVEEVVLRALAKDSRERYVSVQMFATALERASQDSEQRNLDVDLQATEILLQRISPSTSSTPTKVFISASPADTTFAERLRADLQMRGISVWNVTSDDIEGAANEAEAIRQAIRAVDIVLLVASPQARSSRVVREHLHIASIYKRRLVFVWAAGNEMVESLPLVDEQTTMIDAREVRYKTALDEIVARLKHESQMDVPAEAPTPTPLAEPRNPYKGLRAFTTSDAEDFFGRDALIAGLIDKMKGILATEQPGRKGTRLLTVIGPSGSGKSSVVMAGLLPRLWNGALPGSKEWIYLEPVVPGEHPVEALLLPLMRRFPKAARKTVLEKLHDDTADGLHFLATHLAKNPERKVVLLIDQFEELFTLTTSEEERKHFINLLVRAVTEPLGPLIVILTLRADFYDRPVPYPDLGRLMVGNQEMVWPMDINDLRAAIRQPAALSDVQLTFEGNLIGDLLYEVQGQAGALPLLQFTLDQLFQRRKGHLLTYEAYSEIGGVKGALTKQAESTYLALPSEEHRRLARALFLRLIDPGMTEQDTTRRRAALSELTLPAPRETELFQQVTAYFLASRLLTTDETAGTPTIEVSHEALIREWTRLADWLWEAREDIHLQQTISQDATEWEQRDKPRDRLYRGSQLKEAKAWASRNTPSKREVAFLHASAARHTRSVFTVLALVLLLVSSSGITGWFLLHQPVDPTHVTNLLDDGPGSLRQAVALAKPGSTITFDTSLSGTIVLTSDDLNMTKNVIVRGRGARMLTVAGSRSGHHKVHVLAGTFVTFSGLTFTSLNDSGFKNEGDLTFIDSAVSENTTPGNGGGIENFGTLVLMRSIVSGNTVASDNTAFANNKDFGNGGGIANHAILRIIDSTISGNRASGEGGGVYNDFPTASAMIMHSTISGNTVTGTTACRGGGGIANYKGTVTLVNSTVSGNTVGSCKGNIPGASGLGGGITSYGTLVLTGSTISGNKAPVNGGGIYIDSGTVNNPLSPGNTPTPTPVSSKPATLTLTNSTIADNIASGNGGGIGDYGGQVDITFSTIYGNTAQNGGGISVEEDSQKVAGMATMRNSILAGNQAQGSLDIFGTLTTDGYDLLQDISGASIIDKKAGTNLTGISPSIGSLHNNGGQTNTLALLAGSPAIDVIPLVACHVKGVTTDQRGVKRPDGNENMCDIGAYESSF